MVLEDDGRFNFMLQPIRDLTKNWDVDIASHLEDYLEELETVAITFDSGRTMNFAEAALLIQGSTCVYSRKVEYLYALVYEVLDLLVNKKNKEKTNKNKNLSADPDVTFSQEDIEFISLDDIETNKVTLKEKNDKEIATIPRRPMSMVPLGEKEKGNDPLLSKTGDLLGNRNDFRLNVCQVNHDSGLLLEASAHFLSGLKNTPYKETSALTNVATAENIEPIDVANDNCDNPVNPETDVAIDNVDSVDNIDDVPDFEESLKPVEEEEIVTMSLRSRKNAAHKKEKEKASDPWTLEDPFEQKTTTEKPFKKGKTFRIPEVADEKKQKSRKRKKVPVEEKKIEDLEPIEDFITNTLFSYKHKLQKNLRDSCLPEFERLCWTKLSERQAKRKTEIKAMENILEQKILDGENLEDGCEVDGDLNPPSGGDDEDNDDNMVGPVLNLQDDLFDVEDEIPVAEQSKRDEPVSSYEHMVQKHIEEFYIGAHKYAQVTELSKRIAEWEEKILPKLQEEEQHGAFDIRDYSTKIINSLHLGEKFPLARFMSGKPTFEIGRLFLSILMLANTGNVELSSPGVLHEAMDKAEVRLVQTSQHFEELEQYVAPSLANKEN